MKFHPVSATCTSASELGSEESNSANTPSIQIQTDKDDWDKDPEIELDYNVSSSGSSEEENSEDSEKEQSSGKTKAGLVKDINQEELTLGRAQRKPCTPQPVRAPIKKKLDVTSQSAAAKKPKVSQKDSESASKDLKGVKVSLIDTEDKAVQVAPTLRCDHCEITFDDEIVHAIHRGWHRIRDPFQCNICDELCQNKYSFYFHLGRSHTA